MPLGQGQVDTEEIITSAPGTLPGGTTAAGVAVSQPRMQNKVNAETVEKRQYDMTVEADVQFKMLWMKQSGNHASKEKITVPNSSGDSTRFKKWPSLLCSYIFNTGLHELDDEEPMLWLLDQKLSMGTEPQKMIE